MARHVPFTQYEAVLLLDAYLQTISCNVSRKDAIANCSADLRRMAKINGITIDDSYRNINGITFQMASMESAYFGRTAINASTKLFMDTVKMYRDDRESYNRLLKEATLMTGNIQNHEEAFLSWLSQKVTPSQLSELYLSLREIEQHSIKSKLIHQSLYEVIDISLFKKIKTDILRSKLFKHQHKQQMRWVISALKFLEQYAQDQADIASAIKAGRQDSVKSENDDNSKHVAKIEKAKEMIVGPMQKTNRIKVVDFNARTDMSFTKPVAFSYFGDRKKENTWSSLYADLCYCLIEDYPERFDRMLKESMQGISKLWIVDEKHKYLLATPKAAGKGLYVETNRSATDIIKNIRNLLIKCLVDYENVIIEYTKNDNSKSKKAQSFTESRRKDIHDDCKAFYQWMLNDQHMAEATCRSYVSAINYAEKFADEHHFEKKKLLGVSSEDAKEVANLLFGNEVFTVKNESQHNRHRAAITKLLKFYGIKWAPLGAKKRVSINIPKMDVTPYHNVLEKYYPKGYRIGSSIEMNKFRMYYTQENGKKLDLDINKIEELIKQSGIEYNGRVYAPQTMINDELKDRLFSYIDQCMAEGKTTLYFDVIFKKFSEEFLDQRMYDANMLKAYISQTAGDKYYIGRSYLATEKRTIADPIEDVRLCLKEYGLPMSTEDLAKTLSHIPKHKIKEILGFNSEFVRDSKGVFFHADSFSVSKDELKKIAALINTEIGCHDYITGNELYEVIKRKYPSVYDLNRMFSVIGWRNALKYKLGDQYSFNGNIISAKGKKLSMSKVFENFAKKHKEFTLQELSAFEKSLGTNSMNAYLEVLYKNAARISKDKFVTKDLVSFPVKETDKILDRFCNGNYMAISKIKDFGIFPEASHPWTPFLLEHYLAQHSERYYLMHVRYNLKRVAGAMVKTNRIYDSFDEFIADVLAEGEVDLDQKTALNYLADNGYIAKRKYENIEEVLIKARTKKNKKEK